MGLEFIDQIKGHDAGKNSAARIVSGPTRIED